MYQCVFHNAFVLIHMSFLVALLSYISVSFFVKDRRTYEYLFSTVLPTANFYQIPYVCSFVHNISKINIS